MLIAQQFGPTHYGLFVFAVGTGMVASSLGTLGWQTSFNRLMPLLQHQGDWPAVSGLVRAADLVVFLGCTAGAVVLLAIAIFERTLSTGLLFAAMLTVPLGFTLLRRQQLAGAGKAPLALLLDQGFASAAVLLIGLLGLLSVEGLLWMYGAALVLGGIAATWLFKQDLPPDARVTPRKYEMRSWLSSSWSILMGQLARLFLARMDVLLLPALANLTETGLYGAALRITYVLTFPQVLLQTLVGPLLGKAFAGNQLGRARRLIFYSSGLALLTGVPLTIAICVYPSWILRTLFGPEFEDASTALVLLAIGQLGVGASIPLGSALMMGGRESQFWRSNVTVLVVSLALAFVLIPQHGAIGAATVGLVAGLALFASQLALVRPMLRREEA